MGMTSKNGRFRPIYMGLALLLPLLGCDTVVEPTQIVLVVDSNLSAPDEIDQLEVFVFDAASNRIVADASLMAGALALPRTLGIVNNSRRLGGFRVEVHALLNARRIVSRTASFSFTQNQIMRVDVDLVRACIDVDCRAPRTCWSDGVCRSSEVTPRPWGQTVAPLLMEMEMEIESDSTPDSGVGDLTID